MLGLVLQYVKVWYGVVWLAGTGLRCEWAMLVPVVGVGHWGHLWSGPPEKYLKNARNVLENERKVFEMPEKYLMNARK